ncbi:MAG TPA: class I SAM-dependent methyltransferase [Ktedonobacteraceae bacterium]|nr:class I SAM-dependent methyltransferase [Ktedonobacteraceae bacterium]
MSLVETELTNRFTFEAFASHEFYTEINRSLVRQALAPFARFPGAAPLTIVDMACGTGAVTRLIAEEMQRQRQRARIIGVDPSAEALRRAAKWMGTLESNGISTEFIQGDAEDLPRLVKNANAAFFCNAIHLLPDKLAAFRLMSSILAPRGVFACNSGFYQGTYIEGTDRFYRLWTNKAVRWLRKEHPEVRLSREAKAMAMQWMRADEYVDQLRRGGFDHIKATQEVGMISIDAWRDIGHYWLFIEGALPGVPLEWGAAALEKAVYQAGEEMGISATPRNWLQLIASKE